MIAISIIIPFFREESDDFRRMLNSVQTQTLENIEIILVSDASPKPELLALAESFAENDARIKILRHPENRGVSAARNTGLEAAHGEYVEFLDADDFISPNACAMLYKSATEINADMVICGIDLVDGNGQKIRQLINLNTLFVPEMNDATCALLYCRAGWSSCNKLLRRATLGRFREELWFGEDKEFISRNIPNVKSLAMIQDSLYFYVDSSSSVMQKTQFTPRTISQIFMFNQSMVENTRKLPASWHLSRQCAGREILDGTIIRYLHQRPHLTAEAKIEWSKQIAMFWKNTSTQDALFPKPLLFLVKFCASNRFLLNHFKPVHLVFRIWNKFSLEKRLKHELISKIFFA